MEMFDIKEPSAREQIDIDQLLNMCEQLKLYLETHVSTPRYLALSLTSLEQCSMWAKKGILGFK